MTEHTTPTIYLRRCDITGEGMNAGYCICEGAMYIKSEKHLSEHITNETDYASVEDAYDDDYYYYTEWEDDLEDGDTYYDADGNEYTHKA